MTRDSIISILKGAVIAGIGAGLAAFQHGVTGLPIGQVITPFLAAFNSVIVNAIRKIVDGVMSPKGAK